jgi:hypothetical protein
MYNDELFMFGGYYTHRASRFQRAEATVLHDLWTVNMASPTPVWQRLKLAGIPPPIRSGFGFAFKDKRLFLFGGVVDLDGAGGKTVSTFCNDLFVFNMENKRFFPMTLHAAKTKATKQAGAAAAAGGDLAAEIAAAVGRKVVESDSSDDEAVDLLPEPMAPQAPRAALQVTESFVQGGPGQILPCRRMNAHVCVSGNRLVIFGGQFEVGRREVPLCDVFSLNLNKMDTYVCHVSCDVRAVEWLGGDTENSGAGSWEDGSTVADLDALLDRDDDLEEEEASAAGRSQAPEDDDDDAVPVPAAFAAMAAAAAASAVDADGRTTVRGKVGRQHHKEQLKAQLSSTSAIPTPQLEETLKQFFERTESFWLASASENIPSEGVSARKYEKRLREAAQQYCHMRYDEAIDLLRQIEFVERQQAEEEEALREMLRKRREYEAAAAAEEAEESEDDA